jgi:hypothetical protein
MTETRAALGIYPELDSVVFVAFGDDVLEAYRQAFRAVFGNE